MRAGLQRFDIRVSLAYLVTAALWIALSDTALNWLLPLDWATAASVGLLKGFGFVLVTTGALYAVLSAEYRKRARLEDALRQEISVRQQAEAALEKQARLYRVLSDCNQKLIRAADEPALLQAICDVIVEVGGYRFAWVGYAHPDPALPVRPMASAGFANGYLDRVTITWDDSPTGRGPSGTAIRTGQIHTVRFMQTATDAARWRDEALARDYQSLIALPIRVSGQTIGALNIYAAAEDGFDADEVHLLDELAGDLGYGIQALRALNDLRASQAQLAASEGRFRKAVEEAPLPIMIFADDGAVLGISRAWLDITGYSADELRTLDDWLKRAYGERQQSVRAVIDRLFDLDERVDEGEFVIACRDGSQRIWNFSSMSLGPLTDGRRTAISIAADVTERKRAETTLAAALEQNQRILRSMFDGYLLGQPDGTILDVNQAACDMLGYSRDELLQKTVFDLDAGLPRERISSQAQQVVRDDRSLVIETRHRRKDGRLIDVEISSVQLQPGQIACFIRDITERKRAEAALRQSEERLFLALEAANLGLYDLNVQTGEAVVNEQYALMLGYDPATFVETNQKWIERLHPDDRERAVALYRAYISGETPLYQVEFRQRTRSGDWKWILSVGRIMERDSEGRPTRMLGIHRDISQRKQYEIALQQFNQRLLEVQETERRHIARELHDEIGQTLTALSLMLEMVADQPPDQMEAARQQALRLVNDLMHRARSLSLNLRPSLLDDLGLLPTLLWYFERYTRQTGIAVDFKQTGADRRFETQVETTIYRLVQEALTNAARYAHVARITVRLWVRSGSGAAAPEVVVQIEDQGAGFDPETTLAQADRSGLRGMIERVRLAGGTCAIESAPGAGTMIIAQVPFADTPA